MSLILHPFKTLFGLIMFPFESLKVYQKAFALEGNAYKFIKHNRTIPLYMKSQFGRATSSVALNIAEGSARKSKRDRRHFFIIARGSAFESVSIVSRLCMEKELSHDETLAFRNGYEEISRILYTMIENLEK